MVGDWLEDVEVSDDLFDVFELVDDWLRGVWLDGDWLGLVSAGALLIGI